MANGTERGTYVRIINLKHWYDKDQRFSSTAFKPSSSEQDSEKGISIIKIQCAEQESGSVCEHIKRYYPNIAGIPTVFWYIPDSLLPTSPCIELMIDPKINDECHYNLLKISKGEAERLFSKIWADINQFTICQENTERPLTKEDITNWQISNKENN